MTRESALDSNNRILLGGNVFGHFTDLQGTESIIRTAEELGYCGVDTADTYSKGTSEEFLGILLRKTRHRWFIATKVGATSLENGDGLATEKNIRDRLHNSLKRLRTDYIDLYQLHHYDNATPLEETANAFHRLKSEGKIIHAGVSNFSDTHLSTLKQIPNHPFRFNQIKYSLSSQRIDKFNEDRLRIIAYGVLDRGLFNKKYLTSTIDKESRAFSSESIRADLTEDYKFKLKKLNEIALQNNTTVTAIALKHSLSHKLISKVIVGYRSSSQLRDLHTQLTSDRITDSILDEARSFFSAADSHL